MAAAVLTPMSYPTTNPTSSVPIPPPLNIIPQQQQQQQKRRNTLTSPVTVEPQGVYTQDIVLKSGWLNKRTSKTKVGRPELYANLKTSARLTHFLDLEETLVRTPRRPLLLL